MPQSSRFGPLNGAFCQQEPVQLTVDEYEAIRLIDLQGFTQEECAEQMKIARATAQRIYTDARKKLADCLVHGKNLAIEGGEFRLCDGLEKTCRCGGCAKHRCNSSFETDKISN